MHLSTIQEWFSASYGQAQMIAFIMELIAAAIVYFVLNKILIKIIFRISKKTKTKWDDYLFERKFFHKLSLILPLIIFYHFAYLFPDLKILMERLALILMIGFSLSAISAFSASVNDIYSMYKISKHRPIKGYLQIVNIFFYLIGIIIIVGIIINKSPWLLVSGLGAMTAVLLLIFKDTILSLIASLQITFNDLVRIGDWLEVPAYGADGDVIDVALHTVKIQNWDKTISVIPTHKLIEGTFKNWRGMQESGGRRIKRSIHIDLSSIRFCDEEMLEKCKRIQILKDYVLSRSQEIDHYNLEHNIDETELANGRRMTNIGTFRAYVNAYLEQSEKINKNLTFLIRQLAPTATGLPIEIYVFTSDTVWANYEAIQADIFDHILAIIPEFGLRVYQYPMDQNSLPEQTK